MENEIIYKNDAVRAIESCNQDRCLPESPSWRCYERSKNAVRSVEPVGIDVIGEKIQSRMEFLGQIIDIFEDFLEEKGVEIENPDRETDAGCIIYGMDYGKLSDQIEEMLMNWGVLKEVRCIT